MKRRALLVQAIVAAQRLTEPGDPNSEYVRGQAELICDLFGLPNEHSRQDVIELICGHGDMASRPYVEGSTVFVRVTGARAYSEPALVVSDLGTHVRVRLEADAHTTDVLRANVSGSGTIVEDMRRGH